LASHAGLKKIAETNPNLKQDLLACVDLLIQLYEASSQTEKAAQWRKKRYE
jgi:hypothetical protein